MREEADFVGTIVRLMRLTHQRKLEWYREASASDSPFVMLRGDTFTPTYTAEIKNMHFCLEDSRRRPESVLDSFRVAPSYRLIISDLEKDVEIVSPPLQAANDLAAIVGGYDLVQLEEINRRLDAEL